MGLFNVIEISAICPLCGTDTEFEVAVYFGFKNLVRYEIGSKVEWAKGNSVARGARPPKGDFVSDDGLSTCPECGGELKACVRVEADEIREVGLKPD